MKKHIPLLYAILVLLTSSIVFYKCKKVEDQFSLQNGNSNLDLGLFEKNATASNLFSSLVSYNSAYDVLVFNSFNDIKLLEDALNDYDNNYPFDGGMTTSFFAVLDSIELFGYDYEDDDDEDDDDDERDDDDDDDDKSASVSTTGKVAPNAVKAATIGLVNLNRLETNLLLAYPLSDTLLNKIIALNEGLTDKLPKKFIKHVIKPNAPYSYTVRTNIENANINNGVKNKLIKADEDATLVPDFAYNDFLNTFPMFNSLYKELEQVEKTQLESGMDPANPLFDNHFVSDEFMRLILNSSKEVYVNGYLIKLYSDCSWAIFQESLSQAYSDLALLDANGQVTPPTLIETPQGISTTTMNQYVPINYALVNPSYIELVQGIKGGGESIQFIENSPQKRDLCAPSLFSQIRDTANNLLMHFNSFTVLNYQGGTFYQYWNFGDGSGSFITDPNHLYTTAGVYTVKLTTFNNNCGCWDVEEREIGVGFGEKACYATMSFQPTYTALGEYTFTVDYADNTNLNASLIEYVFNFGDGHSQTVLPLTTSVTHQYAMTVPYKIVVQARFNDGCTARDSVIVSIPVVECCVREDEDTFIHSSYDIFGDGNFRLIIKDRVYGTRRLFANTVIKTKQTFYTRRTFINGFKEKKAELHTISVAGTVRDIDANNLCSTERSIVWNQGVEQNGKKLRHSKDIGYLFGFKDNDISISHYVSFGNLSNSVTIEYGCP